MPWELIAAVLALMSALAAAAGLSQPMPVDVPVRRFSGAGAAGAQAASARRRHARWSFLSMLFAAVAAAIIFALAVTRAASG